MPSPEVEELQQEIDRLRGLLQADPVIKSLRYTSEEGLELEVQHWAVRLLVASLLDTFQQCGGQNFVTLNLLSKEGPIEVTIRPCWGNRKTTAEVLDDLRQEIAGLRGSLAQVLDPDTLSCLLASYSMDDPHISLPDLDVGQEDDQHYPAISKESFQKHLQSPHHGDCVGLPSPCVRCFAEMIRHEAVWLSQRLRLLNQQEKSDESQQ